MPRIIEPLTKTQHSFAWSVFMEQGGPEINLFERTDTILPPRNVDPIYVGAPPRQYVGGFVPKMYVLAVSLTRPDAVLTLDVGSCNTTFTGPWLVGIQSGKASLPAVLEIPARQSLRALLRLLPGAPAGLVTVHLACLFYGKDDNNWAKIEQPTDP